MEKIAGVIFYNDGSELLKQSLEALKRNKFKIIGVDGAFKEFLKGDSLLEARSEFETYAIAKSYCDVLIEAPEGGWDTQVDKRNAYVKEVPNGKYFWVIDADEIIEDFTLNDKLTCDLYRIQEYRHKDDGTVERMTSVRIYKKYPDLQYAFQHCRLYRMDERNIILNNIKNKLGSVSITDTVLPTDNIEAGLVMKGVGLGWCVPLLCKSGDDRSIISFHHRCDLRSAHRKELKQLYYKSRAENAIVY